MLEIRQAAVRGVVVSGILQPQLLKRFRPLLADDEGLVSADIFFSRDEERRYIMRVEIDADVMVTCQRCLEAMPEHLSSKSILAIVWTDEEATHVPKHLEALVVDDAPCSLWEVVEDELILALPSFSYHATENCKKRTLEFSDPDTEKNRVQEKPNPFNVLAQLKTGDK
jgi:uncharacterized protein